MPRGRGPLSFIGQGVAMAAEYREHRKQQQEARNTSQEEASHTEERALSSQSQERRQSMEQPSNLPPAAQPPPYSESTGGSEVPPLRSEPPSESGKRTPSPYEGDSDFDSETSSLGSLEDDEGDWELDDLEQEESITPPGSLTKSASGADGPPSYEESEAQKAQQTPDDLVHEVMAISAETQMGKAHQPLPCPVVLPQRRPRKKARGFVRAYSPVLQDCGIDQKTFLTFLKSFSKASQASPIFPVIQLSAAIAGLAPSVIAMAVCTGVQVAATVGAEVQSRSRTNNFLDRMNAELFQPHGLYAMIVKYKSDAEEEKAATGGRALLSTLIKAEQVDMSTSQIIAKYTRQVSDGPSESGIRGFGERMQGLRLASDTTRGAIHLPESAPLIFPDLDYKLQHDGPETFKDKTKDAKKFLADYLDRRAQMQYAKQDPNSALALPEDQRGFKSKLADPNHPMHSGGLMAVLSGGTITPGKWKEERRREKHESKRERRMERDVRRLGQGRDLSSKKEGKRARRYGEDFLEELAARRSGDGRLGGPRAGLEGFARSRGGIHAQAGAYGQAPSRVGYDRRRGGRGGRGGPGGMIGRVMREDVLYLMMVNMPSEGELQEARQELEMARRGS